MISIVSSLNFFGMIFIMATKLGHIFQPSSVMPLSKNPFRIDLWVFDRIIISGVHPQKSTNESLLDFFLDWPENCFLLRYSLVNYSGHWDCSSLSMFWHPIYGFEVISQITSRFSASSFWAMLTSDYSAQFVFRRHFFTQYACDFTYVSVTPGCNRNFWRRFTNIIPFWISQKIFRHCNNCICFLSLSKI